MRIFVSWSGTLSQRVALILREWLPNVIQTIDVYVSSEDIDKGTRWASDISKALEGASLGIICLTQSNLTAPWILFEAGALSKSIERARVVPLLIDVSPSDVQGPLVQFQASSVTEEDIGKMVKDINTSLGEQSIDSKRVEISFRKWWPDLERSLQEAKSQASDSAKTASTRSDRDLLEELLELSRQISKTAGDPARFSELVNKNLVEFSSAFLMLEDRLDSRLREMFDETAIRFRSIMEDQMKFHLVAVEAREDLAQQLKQAEADNLHLKTRLQESEATLRRLQKEIHDLQATLQQKKTS